MPKPKQLYRDTVAAKRANERLESAGLLNYQTRGLSQGEISQRYQNAGVGAQDNWFQQNYGDRPAAPQVQTPSPQAPLITQPNKQWWQYQNENKPPGVQPPSWMKAYANRWGNAKQPTTQPVTTPAWIDQVGSGSFYSGSGQVNTAGAGTVYAGNQSPRTISNAETSLKPKPYWTGSVSVPAWLQPASGPAYGGSYNPTVTNPNAPAVPAWLQNVAQRLKRRPGPAYGGSYNPTITNPNFPTPEEGAPVVPETTKRRTPTFGGGNDYNRRKNLWEANYYHYASDIMGLTDGLGVPTTGFGSTYGWGRRRGGGGRGGGYGGGYNPYPPSWMQRLYSWNVGE